MARSIFKKLDILVAEVPPKKRDAVFKPVLPAVVSFCEIFPPLCSDATSFLLHLCKICSSDVSVSTGHFVGGSETNETGQLLANNVASNKPFVSQDPVFGLEDKLMYLRGISLKDGACWAFQQIVKLVVLTVSGKA